MSDFCEIALKFIILYCLAKGKKSLSNRSKIDQMLSGLNQGQSCGTEPLTHGYNADFMNMCQNRFLVYVLSKQALCVKIVLKYRTLGLLW